MINEESDNSNSKLKNIFKLNRLRFYPLLLLITCILAILSFFLIKLIIGDCNGMECLAIGFFVWALLIFFSIILFIINVIIITNYERKNKDNKKYNFMLPIYIIFILLIITAPSIYNVAKEIKYTIEMKNYDSKMQDFTEKGDYGGCVKYIKKKGMYFSNEGINDCDIHFSLHNAALAEETGDLSNCTSDLCLYTYAVATNRGVYCHNITSAWYRDNCFINISINLGNISICEEGIYSDSKNFEIISCILKIIEKQNTLKEDNKSIGNTQKINYNSTPCYNIKNVYAKEECILTYSINFSECYNLTLQNYANDINNKDICIGFVSSRINTTDYPNALDECLNISDQYKGICIINTARNVEECNLITGNDSIGDYIFSREDCYNNLAKKTGDISMCLIINNTESYFKKSSCISAVATNIKDCDIIPDEASKDGCINSIAHKVNDYTFCLNISSNILKDECISELAIKRGDCTQIKENYWKEKCKIRTIN